MDPEELQALIDDLVARGRGEEAIARVVAEIERAERASSKTSRVTLDLRCRHVHLLDALGKSADAEQMVKKARRLHENLDRPGSLSLLRLDELEADRAQRRGASTEAVERYRALLEALSRLPPSGDERTAMAARVELKSGILEFPHLEGAAREDALYRIRRNLSGPGAREIALNLLRIVLDAARAAPEDERVPAWILYRKAVESLSGYEVYDRATWQESTDVLIADLDRREGPYSRRALEGLRGLDRARHRERVYERADPELLEARLAVEDRCGSFANVVDSLLELTLYPPGSESPWREKLTRRAHSIVEELAGVEAGERLASSSMVFGVNGLLEEIATACEARGDHAAASSALSVAYGMTIDQMGDDHSETRRIAGLVAHAMEQEGREEAAARFLEQVAENQVERFGQKSDRVTRFREAADALRRKS